MTSAIKTKGPGGGGVGSVSWVCGMKRRGPRGVRPRVRETEKQVTPAVDPPLATQAVYMRSSVSSVNNLQRGTEMYEPVFSFRE